MEKLLDIQERHIIQSIVKRRNRFFFKNITAEDVAAIKNARMAAKIQLINELKVGYVVVYESASGRKKGIIQSIYQDGNLFIDGTYVHLEQVCFFRKK